MKIYFIITILILSVLASCLNDNSPKKKTDSPKVITIELPSKTQTVKSLKSTIKSFNWTKAIILKSKLVSDLKEHSQTEDSLIVHFISEYSALENDFNDILFDLSNYDSLNTLAYSENNLIYQCAIDFKEKVEKGGFAIGYSEGNIYIVKSTNLIKSDILSLISPISMEFIDLYCNDIDTICCDDAALIISIKTLTERILKWGELLDKASELKYSKIAESKFKDYLFILYNGQDNTPAFDWISKEFNQKALQNMLGIIARFPNSKASKEFKTYIDLLKQEGFKETEKISQFLADKFYDKYN